MPDLTKMKDARRNTPLLAAAPRRVEGGILRFRWSD
jgi:hypothetical protein